MAGNEVIGAELRVDGAPAKKTVGEFLSEIQICKQNIKEMLDKFGEGSDEVVKARNEMAALKEEFKQANAPVESLRSQLRQATQDLVQANEQFGTMSPEAGKAAQRVAELRDSIADANSLAEAFNPDKKFQAFSQALGGVTGGFAAVQGGMALLGIQSESVEKTLLKVQSAMALSQGLNSVLDSVQSFKNLGAVLANIGIIQRGNAVATTLATGAMRAFGVSEEVAAAKANLLKTAIVSTGIGALIVAIGVCISYLMNYANAAEEATEKQKAFNDSIIEGANAQKEGELSFIDQQEKLDTAKAKAKGASESEISTIQENAQRLRIKSLQRHYEEVKSIEGEREKSQKEVNDAIVTLQVKGLERQQKAREENERKAKEAEQKAKQARDKALAETKQALQEALQAEQQTAEEINKLRLSEEEKEQYDLSLRYSQRINAYNKVGKDTAALVEAYEGQSAAIYDKYREQDKKKREDDERDKKQKREQEASEAAQTLNQGLDDRLYQLEQEKADYDARRDLIVQFNNDVIENDKLTDHQRTELLRQGSEARKKIDAEEHEAKKAILNKSAGVLDSFAELAGEQTALGKTLAIASTTISTYLAAQEAYASLASIPYVGPYLGAAAAAAAIASGLLRVKKIVSVKVPGGTGAGGGGSGTGLDTSGFQSTAINSNAPITPQGAAGGSGMNDMLGQMKKTSDDTNNTLKQLNNTLANGINATVMEGDINKVQNRTASIQTGATFGK